MYIHVTFHERMCMSREAGIAAMGYFPMPPHLMAPVCAYLRRPYGGGQIHIVDTCAGEGTALRALQEHLDPDAVARAIELHEGRAAQSAALFGEGMVVQADALTGVEVAPDAFGLLWLNPPYHLGQFELEFLMAHTPLLHAGGILCLVVPQPALATLAEYLAAWYTTVTCYTFPEPDYRAYKQVVLFGERKPSPLAAPPQVDRLRGLAEPDADLPALGAYGYRYIVPATPGPALFRARSAEAVPAAGGLWDDPEVTKRLWPPLTPTLLRPLMPLSRGHLAQFGVSGLLRNTVLHATDGTPYLVKGRAIKARTVRAHEEENEKGNSVSVRITRESAETGVTLLNLQTGAWVDARPGNKERSLSWFVEEFGASLTRAILDTCPPIYSPALYKEYRPLVKRLARQPLGRQADALAGVALSLERGYRCTILSAEMGAGKSFMALAALYTAWCRTRERDADAYRRMHALVICPTHLVGKWVREAQATIPGVRATVVESISEIEAALRHTPTTAPLILVLSKERAKLGHPLRPAVWDRLMPWTKERRLCCPQCGAMICYTEKCGREGKERLGVPLMDARVCVRYRLFCEACHAPLWQADTTLLRVPHGQLSGLQPQDRPFALFEHGRTVKASGGGAPRRVPLGAYIAKRRRNAFDVLVLDEVQDYKADGSAQGIIAGQLAAAIPQVLALTGTLYGGVASSLFHLLYRLNPVTREEFAYSDLARWIETYGLYEITEKETEGDRAEIGHVTRRRTNRTTTRREIPGLMPQLIARLARHTIFLRLADVAPDLPAYEEHVTSVAMLPQQQRAYDRLKGDLLSALKEALVRGSKRLLGAYLQSLLAYPDASYREEVVTDPKDDHVIARAPALDEDVVYPKEQTLLDLIARELGQRRKVLVYVQHTGSRDITVRLVRLLAERHVKAVVLHSSVEAKTREAWVEARLREGVQVLITHPKCVQTGLDLLAFPTLVFYQCEYSAYVVAQASRRSWRIGQRHAVQVHHVVYANSTQENALRLVARKRRAAKLVDGDLDEDGLVAQAEMDGLLKELARSLVDEEAGASVESAEELLAQAHADELADTALIVEATTDADVLDENGTDDEGTAGVATDEAHMEVDLAPAATGVQTMTLFDYIAARPAARPRKGRKERARTPSAQLLLFDLFTEQPATTDVADAPTAPVRQVGLFANDEREEVA